MTMLEKNEAVAGINLDKYVDDEEKLEVLTSLYLRGVIELEEYQQEIDQLQTQPDFRELADSKMGRFFGLR